MRPNFNSSSKPKLACEIAPDRVLAGRVSERGHMVEVCAASELASGSVVPDLMEAFWTIFGRPLAAWTAGRVT
jgi:hypothetical protein